MGRKVEAMFSFSYFLQNYVVLIKKYCSWCTPRYVCSAVPMHATNAVYCTDWKYADGGIECAAVPIKARRGGSGRCTM